MVKLVMMELFNPRTIFVGIFLVCAALIGYALYMQHGLALDPCPLCILQRYAFIVVGVTALIAAIHNPRAQGLTIYGGFVALFAGVGGAVAIRHSWLQHYPNKLQSCGADLDYLLNTLPLSRALPAIFRGTGECSEVQWRFLGLSIPEWALVWFVIFAVLAVVVAVKTRRSQA